MTDWLTLFGIGVYKVSWGKISICEEEHHGCEEEYNVEKRERGSNIIFPIILRLLWSKSSRKELREQTFWGRKSSRKVLRKQTFWGRKSSRKELRKQTFWGRKKDLKNGVGKKIKLRGTLYTPALFRMSPRKSLTKKRKTWS